jgi:hypothetical protein
MESKMKYLIILLAVLFFASCDPALGQSVKPKTTVVVDPVYEYHKDTLVIKKLEGTSYVLLGGILFKVVPPTVVQANAVTIPTNTVITFVVDSSYLKPKVIVK